MMCYYIVPNSRAKGLKWSIAASLHVLAISCVAVILLFDAV